MFQLENWGVQLEIGRQPKKNWRIYPPVVRFTCMQMIRTTLNALCTGNSESSQDVVVMMPMRLYNATVSFPKP